MSARDRHVADRGVERLDGIWLLNSLVVVIIGGMGSLVGAAVGALLFGMIEVVRGDLSARRQRAVRDHLHVRAARHRARRAAYGIFGGPREPVRTIERTIGRRRARDRRAGAAAVPTYTVDALLTQVLIFGIVDDEPDLSRVLRRHGLARADRPLRIAGFVFGNLTTVETKGLNLGYSPWIGIIPAILIATAIGLV